MIAEVLLQLEQQLQAPIINQIVSRNMDNIFPATRHCYSLLVEATPVKYSLLALRTQVRRRPPQGSNGFSLSAGLNNSPGEAGQPAYYRLDPGFEKKIHGENPGQALQIAQAGQAPFVYGPLYGLRGKRLP